MYSFRVDLFNKAGDVVDLIELEDKSLVIQTSVVNLLRETSKFLTNKTTFQVSGADKCKDVEWSLAAKITARALRKRFKRIMLVGLVKHRNEWYSKIVEMDLKNFKYDVIEEERIDNEYAKEFSSAMDKRASNIFGICKVLRSADGKITIENSSEQRKSRVA